MINSVLNIFSIAADHVNCQVALLKGAYKAKTFTYAVSQGTDMKLDLYIPEEAVQESSIPVIIYLHGGGWKVGSRKDIQPAVWKQLERGFAIASISYSFSSKANWPTQVHELKAAIRFLKAHAEQLHLDKERVYLWGISAGAHIASVAGTSSGTHYLEGDLGYSTYSSEVRGVVLWYSPVDLAQMSFGDFSDIAVKKVVSDLLGVDVYQEPEAAKRANPITYIHSGTPPFFLIHGKEDRIVKLSQSILLCDALKAHGIEVVFRPIAGYYHADIRFNEPKHMKEMELFLDAHSTPKP